MSRPAAPKANTEALLREGTPVSPRPSSPIGERIVKCPACGNDSLYAARNPYRPFCSARCKGIDLGAWASEEFRVPAESPPDDDPFGDPKRQ